MTQFYYEGINKAGNNVSGELEAESKEKAKQFVEGKGLVIKTLKKKPELTFSEWLKSKKISEKDIMLFTKYLGVVLKAGIPILKCINILTGQVENYRLRKKLNKIKGDIEGGSSLSDAFGKHADVFPNIYINLLNVGEESGLLYEMVSRLTVYYEKNSALKKKVKSAMVYPMIIVFVAGAVTIFLLVFIIPKFGAMFDSFGAELPKLTQVVLGLSNFVREKIGIIIGLLVGIFGAVKYALKSEKIQYMRDKFLLKIPLLGQLVVKYAVASFTSNLGILLQSGLPITKGMYITVNAIDNKVIKEQMEKVKDDVESGVNITDAFRNSEVMPSMVVEMINIGDQSGVLEDMLTNISEFYTEEVDTLVDAVTGMIEPLFMMFLGVTIGTLVLSMFLPIFKMSSAIQT
ncbi:MAG: pilus assembly protein PilC [Candidatus Muiribacterium halophilum]|mgnify:CR=1 FL=1|uniref:Pilus assembly protein PilC n=1 Tax=Muiribacterium halophilum TaxID=2053465 RepID=A0A2N5ZCM1_MUIH1|nr:MAG: pilus assembly protein PilC [Candidatus Muirbacterium halophilum]